MIRNWIALGLAALACPGFVFLLVRHWDVKPMRFRAIGNIFLILLVPAVIILRDHGSLLLTVVVCGGLLGPGLVFRWLGERGETR